MDEQKKTTKPKRCKASKAKAQSLVNYNTGKIERSAGERWITMDNALIRAGQGLTLGEKRIVMLAVSKLDSYAVLPPGEVPTTRITAAEFAELFQVDADTAYKQLQDAAKQLYQRSITFYEPVSTRRSKALEPTRVTMHWVGQVHYQKGEGWIELYWWPKLLPALTGIRKQFTTYQLQQASALRSVYSWRLLELLMRFKSTGTAEYTIDKFCVAMEATEKQRGDFAAIRRKIIEPAVKELIEKDGWLIQWYPIKAGRKVKAVRFVFALKTIADELAKAAPAMPSEPESRAENIPDMFTATTPPERRKRRKTITKQQAEAIAIPGESYPELYKRLSSEYIIK